MPVVALFNFDAAEGLAGDNAPVCSSPEFPMDRGTLHLQMTLSHDARSGTQTILSRDTTTIEDGACRIDLLQDGAIMVSHATASGTTRLCTAAGFAQPGDEIDLIYAWDAAGTGGHLDVSNLVSGARFSEPVPAGLSMDMGPLNLPWVVGTGPATVGAGDTADAAHPFDGKVHAFSVSDTVDNREITGFRAAEDKDDDEDDDECDDKRDGIVSGTQGNDLIDLAYTGDPDGDRVDNEDAILPGDKPNDDRIEAGAGNDTVRAGLGEDTVNSGQGDDLVFGEKGNDRLDGGTGNDTLQGDAGNDTLFGGAGRDVLYGLDGDDVIKDTDGFSVLIGGTGNDSITGSDDNNIIYGDDSLGAASFDAGLAAIDARINLAGTSNNDTIFGGRGRDTIFGGGGQDRIFGLSASDSLFGGDGDDTVDGGSESDVIDGGAGQDSLIGASGDDTLSGGDGDDRIFGGSEDDQLFGGSGQDFIGGGTGADTLTGGIGADSMFGGDDRDVFFGGFGDFVDGGSKGDDVDTLFLESLVPTGGRVDLQGVTTDPDGDSTSGTAIIRDASGGEIGRVVFTEIEKLVPCFTPGTMIATPQGEVPVENLRPGDRVITRDNGLQEIRWIGSRALSSADLHSAPHLKPVLVRQGSLGNGLPERDMMVSPNHRLLVANDRTALYFEEHEVLVAAKHLISARGVQTVDAAGMTYIHFMCDRHEVVLSNGAWTESFQPGDLTLKGMGNAQRSEIFELFPELTTDAGLKNYAAARRTLKRHEAMLLTR